MNGGLSLRLRSRLHLSQRAHRPAAGFTIVEVLIVLAVTGALFLAAVLLISGKQQVTSFNQSIRSIQTQMQQVVNDVGSGFYQNDGNIKCDKGGSGLLLTSLSTEQGTNKDCIFIGKVVQFALLSTDPEEFNIYTIVGLSGDSVTPSTDLSTAKARLIARGTAASDSGIPEVFDTKTLLYGLTATKMYYRNAAGGKVADIGAVGFTSSLANLGAADSSQQVNVVAVTGTALQRDKATGVQNINDNLKTAVVNPPGGVQICFTGGGTNQSGLLSIGGSGRQGSVDLQIFNNTSCT